MRTDVAVTAGVLIAIVLLCSTYCFRKANPFEKEKGDSIFEMTTDAVFIALLLLMSFVPNLGYISVPPVTFTLMHLPVLFAAAIGGPKKGALVGLMFGISSYLKALTVPSGFDVLFAYPWVAIPPRFLLGLIAGFVFAALEKLSKGKGKSLYLAIASALLTVMHTVLVFADLYCFYPDTIGGLLSSTDPIAEATTLTFLLVILLGMAGEAAIAAILNPLLYNAVVKAVPRLRRKKGKKA